MTEEGEMERCTTPRACQCCSSVAITDAKARIWRRSSTAESSDHFGDECGKLDVRRGCCCASYRIAGLRLRPAVQTIDMELRADTSAYNRAQSPGWAGVRSKESGRNVTTKLSAATDRAASAFRVLAAMASNSQRQ